MYCFNFIVKFEQKKEIKAFQTGFFYTDYDLIRMSIFEEKEITIEFKAPKGLEVNL